MPSPYRAKNLALIELLITERARLDLLQKDLAAALGKPQSFIAKVDGGERRLDPANRLELEVTESIASNRSERLVSIMNALRDLGISFALDDFGTGYSGLSHIQRLPIDRIKIDKSFVAELETNKRSRSLVEAVIRMGHALDLKVLAEGVERESQLEILCKLGCDELQGYLLAKPQLIARQEPSAAI